MGGMNLQKERRKASCRFSLNSIRTVSYTHLEEQCRLCELGDGISIREVERAIVRYGEAGKRSSVFRIRKKKKAAIFGSGLFPLFLAGELEKKMYPTTIYCKEEEMCIRDRIRRTPPIDRRS